MTQKAPPPGSMPGSAPQRSFQPEGSTTGQSGAGNPSVETGRQPSKVASLVSNEVQPPNASGAWPTLKRHLKSALPCDSGSEGFKLQLPGTRLESVVLFALGVVFTTYVISWAIWYWPWLSDVRFQNDDARIQLFAFHRFGPEKALLNDEMALDQLAAVPPGFVALYAVLVPVVGLYAASKVVQLLFIAIVFSAGLVVARRRNLGLGLLFVFLILQSNSVMSRMAGGLPRGFGYPLLALWAAGALTQSGWTRAIAAALGAVFYPSVAAMILGAEGMLQLAGLTRVGRSELFARAKRYSLIVFSCVVLIVPFGLVQGARSGPPMPVSRAQEMKLFTEQGRLGRSERLPLTDPQRHVAKAGTLLFETRGKALWPKAASKIRDHGSTIAFLIFAGIGVLILMRATTVPYAALAIAGASFVLYALARLVAFRLYVPVRFIDLGLPIATLCLVIGILHELGRRFMRNKVHPFLNGAGALVMLGWWTFLGPGYKYQPGMQRPDREHREALTFVRQLPVTARLAGHPDDADDIPYWTARGTITNRETACPWFVDNWERYERRTRDTLEALYASERREVLAFAKAYEVSHFYLRKSRYDKKKFRKNAASFEPFSSLTSKLLKEKSAEALALSRPPKQAIVFENDELRLLDVKLLEKAWRTKAKKPRSKLRNAHR